jgi:hypothetical protein
MDISSVISALAVLAAGVQKLIDVIKGVIPYSKLTQPVAKWLTFMGQPIEVQQLIDIVLVESLDTLGCFMAGINLFSALSTQVPFFATIPAWLGVALTGLFIAPIPTSGLNAFLTWLENLNAPAIPSTTTTVINNKA